MKRRILFLHQSSSVGGGSYCLLNIIKAINKDAFEPIVALKSQGPLVEELIKDNVKTLLFEEMASVPYNQSIFKLGSVKAYIRVYKSRKRLGYIIKDNDIDVVYLNNMMLYPYLKVAKQCECGTVIHVREHWPLSEHMNQLGLARRYVSNYADRTIAINKYSASIFPDVDVNIIYDWIDFTNRSAPFEPKEYISDFSRNTKILLFTGGFSAIKGTLEVVRNFRKCIEGNDYKLLLLGDYNQIKSHTGLKHKIKLFLRSFGYKYYSKELVELIDNDKRIVCMQPTYAIKEILDNAYCMISYFTIPHANLALAEAIIRNIPCIAAKTEESMEYSGEGELAYLYNLRDEAEFIKSLRHIDEIVNSLKAVLPSKSKDIAMLFSPSRNINILNTILSEL